MNRLNLDFYYGKEKICNDYPNILDWDPLTNDFFNPAHHLIRH